LFLIALRIAGAALLPAALLIAALLIAIAVALLARALRIAALVAAAAASATLAAARLLWLVLLDVAIVLITHDQLRLVTDGKVLQDMCRHSTLFLLGIGIAYRGQLRHVLGRLRRLLDRRGGI